MSGFTKVIGVAIDSVTKLVGISPQNMEKLCGVAPAGDDEGGDGGDGGNVDSFLQDTWNDAVAGTNSTMYGLVGSSSGFQDNIMTLDGNTYLTDNDTSYLYASNFSFSIWFKFQGNDSTTYAAFSFNNMGNRGPFTNVVGFHVEMTDTQVKTMTHYYDQTNYTATSSLNDNNWHHYVYTHDGTARVYVDGTLRASKATNGIFGNTVHLTSTGITIGKHKRENGYSGTNFIGQFTNGKVHNSTLSSSEVTTLYNAGPTG